MIHIFDMIEFQVLAAAKGMDAIYGFMTEEMPEREQAYMAVYQMTRDGILKQDREGLVIQPPISAYMDVICGSPRTVVIDRGQYQLPRQCIYQDSKEQGRYVCLENSLVDRETLCLTGMSWEELRRQMEDLNQLPAPRLEQEAGDYEFEEYWETHMPDTLRALLLEGLTAETEALLTQEPVHTVFSLREKASGTLEERMIVVEFPLEYCLVYQGADGASRREAYRPEAVVAIWETWWRNAG